MPRPLVLAAAALLAVLSACSRHVAAPAPAAPATPAAGGETVVYTAARIWTLDAGKPQVRALAVRGGKVLAVGTPEEVRAAAGEGARAVDLGDATLVPGLVDAHGHVVGLGQSLASVALEGVGSAEEAVARVVEGQARARRGDWVMGRGWDQNRWPDKQFPDRALLDARFPSTPVVLGRVDGHAYWVNGEALRRAGITRATQDPAGGRILRDANGEPTGVLVDNAMDAVDAALPAYTDAQLADLVRAALRRCAEVGLTGVHDAGTGLAAFRVMQKLDAAGELPLRVYALADGQTADRHAFLQLGPQQGRHLVLRGVKLSADGALGSRGAALHQPYADEPGHTGLLLLAPDEYERRARAFAARGFQVATHAIGDRANTLVLDVTGRLPVGGGKDARHRVEHAQVMRQEDIARLAQAGLVASVQPTHATSDMPWAEARVGPERIRGAYAWRQLAAAGAVLALGSDFPVERPDPLLGLYAARTRQDADGRPPDGWYPAERLTGLEALAGFTTGSAFAEFAEARRGRLAPGLDADFVALSADPVEGPPQALLSARVLLTVVDGAEVFRADAAASR